MNRQAAMMASILAVTLVVSGCNQETEAPAPVRPVLSTVVELTLPASTVAVGTIEPRYTTNMGFRVLGRLIARPVNVGDLVEEGQTFAAIDPTTFELAVQSARAELSRSKARLANASATEERKRTLIVSDSTTKASLDDAEYARAGAQASVAGAQANLTKALEQLSYARLKAEFAGVVTAVSADVGQVVSPGQTVITVARPEAREAVVDVGSDFPGALQVGLPFTVSLQLLPAIEVEGRIREIAPQADDATRMRRIRIALIDPPPSFRLGSTVTARLSNLQNEVLRVPTSAVLTKDGDTFVWVVDPAASTVSLRKVALSADASGMRVNSGLAAGTRIVTAGIHSLKQGQQVRNRRGRSAMSSFNLSDWALKHRSLVWYFMLAFMVAGLFAYLQLGRREDPDFTIKTMVIQAQWPGASAEEVTRQVTDRIEKKLEELESLDYTKSVTVAGQTTVFVYLRDSTKASDVAPTWARVRNMIADIKADLPQGVIGPGFNDRFGDVFGNIYAFTSDGLSLRQLRDQVEDIRAKILTVPNVGKVDILGAQDEVIYLEFSTRKIAALGIDSRSIMSSLQAQNAVTASGVFQEGPERISVRVSGEFASEASLKAINLRINDRFFPLTDVATITRGYADPPTTLFRFNGQPAIALAIGMKSGANLLKFGEALKEEMSKIVTDLPMGVGVHLVADQPVVVEHAVSGFTEALFEAIVIVLGISFISLGLRAGLVVAIAIPLVLAITFVAMAATGISLQRISLGALIIALGLLVDDAMIAVEMMVARLEVGDPLPKAATYVYTSTAFPMLTGTLVTVAGFIPIGLNSSNAGEYTFTLFVVIAVSLIVSWIVAVLFTPLLGVTILPAKMKGHHEFKGRLARMFSRLLAVCMRHRWITIGVTVAAFVLALFGMQFVQQQFFPSSDRDELIVDWNLPQNASIAETNAQIARFEREQLQGNDAVDHWSTYVGTGAPRFVLSFDLQTANTWFGQIVIVAKGGIKVRDRVKEQFESYLRTTFPGTDTFVKLLEVGPPVGRPVQYRLSGPNIAKVKELSESLAAIVRSNPHLNNVVFNWMEPARVVKVDVLQDKARQLGVSSEDIATTLNSVLNGTSITQVRDSIYLINVVDRATAPERASIETLRDLQLIGLGGQSVPLGAVANIRYEIEQPTIWRRSRLPTITLQASIRDDVQPNTVGEQLAPRVADFEKRLPSGYSVVVGGSVEESAKSQGPIKAVLPLMLFIMATILMIQLQSFSRLFLVWAVAPLALIGVVLALLPSGAPLGFVAILGVLALIGILIRNSVILIVQIEELRKEGRPAWEAVVEATEHQFRPIMLTAAAASLALIPIAREIFWGPMAYAMMGGIIVGTLLTLLFLPALYVAWFRIKQPDQAPCSKVAKLSSGPNCSMEERLLEQTQ